MNVVVISESPNKLRRSYQEAAARVWPQERVQHLLTYRFGPYAFRYPRGLPWASYPYLEPPRYHWQQGWPGKETRQEVSRMLHEASLIVCACDPDHSGITPFERLLDLSLGTKRRDKEVRYARLGELSLSAVERALGQATPEPLAHAHRYGLAKSYFDYNFNLNSAAVLGRTLRSVGVDRGGELLSKYQVQALYALKGRQESEGDLIRRLAHWRGTGKYPQGSARLGGPVSYLGILEGLTRAGLLERVTRPVERSEKGKQLFLQRNPGASPMEAESRPVSFLSLSSRGEALLEHLHPDCQDPDLPFRLDAWCTAGLEESEVAMSRYLRSWFGRQIRFLAKRR